MRKTFAIVNVALLLMLSIPVTENVRADEQTVTLDFSVVKGIDASFGFTMQYNPSYITVNEGDDVALSYAPEPKDATVVVDFRVLLTNCLTLDERIALVDEDVWYHLPSSYQLNITETPLGTYELTSIPIYNGGLIGSINLNVDIIGQINASASASSGYLNETAFKWTKWGGKELTLSTSGTTGEIDVKVKFVYYVEMAFDFKFNILGVPILEEEVASFPLGEKSFRIPVISTVTIISSLPTDTATAESASNIILYSIIGIIIGIIIGVATGYVIGKGKKVMPPQHQPPQLPLPPPPPP